MQITIAGCVLAYVIGGASATQAKPDFSGRWVLTASTDVNSNAAQELAISQADETPWTVLNIERRSKDGVRSERYRTGVRQFVERREGPNTRLEAKWDGDTLVFERGTYSGRAPESRVDTMHEERWSIDPQGMLLIIVADRSASAEARTRLLYQKR
jgi:hypothetical protein